MQALKKFISSSHFITLAVFCSLSMALFFGLLDLPNNKSLGDAKASVTPYTSYPTEFSSSETKFEEIFHIQGELLVGDTLSKSFNSNKVPAETVSLVFKYLSEMVDFKKLRPGDRYSIDVGANDELVKCVYEISPLESYTVKLTDSGYKVERDKKFLEVRKIRLTGEVSTTLLDAFPVEIKTPKLVYALADIFSGKIDFNTETRVGDSFDLIVEEFYLFGEFIGYGSIMAGKYQRVNGDHFEAFKHNPNGKSNLGSSTKGTTSLVYQAVWT